MTGFIKKTAKLIISLALVLLAMTITLGVHADAADEVAVDEARLVLTEASFSGDTPASLAEPSAGRKEVPSADTASDNEGTYSAETEEPGTVKDGVVSEQDITDSIGEEDIHGGIQNDAQAEQSADSARSDMPGNTSEAGADGEADAASGDTEAVGSNVQVDISRAPILIKASAPASGSGSAETSPVLQSLIDSAMKSVTGTLSGKLQVVLQKDVT